jgi:hypothetical protein
MNIYKFSSILFSIFVVFDINIFAQSGEFVPSRKVEKEIILNEQFNNYTNNWNLVKSERFSQIIENGKLIAHSSMATQEVYAFIEVPYRYNKRNYEISISFANLNAYGGIVYNKAGKKQHVDFPYWAIFWGGDSKTRNYNAVIFYGYEKFDHQTTTYKVVTMISGEVMEYETFSSQYPTGLGPGDTFKKLKIKKRGDKCYIYDEMVKKDGGLLAVIPNPECYGNNIGILGEPGAKVIVDFLKIKGESDYSYTRKFNKTAWNAIENNNYNKAYNYFDKVIQSGFKHPSSYCDRAYTSILREDYNKALSDLDRALLYNENYEKAYFLRGIVKYKLDYEKEKVISDLKKGGKKGKKAIKKYYPDYNKSKVTGSGIIFSEKGYIATNYHVIEDSKNIVVYISDENKKKSFKAEIVLADKSNDLAILKIKKDNFKEINKIPFDVKSTGVQVGENVFALGYPMINLQGTELKVTKGIINSKSGYKNDLSSYQISAPIQPGNSGGPLFDQNGNLIGITSSKLTVGENVGYAIKGLFLKNIIDNISGLSINTKKENPTLKEKPLPQQVKILRDYVVIISANV